MNGFSRGVRNAFRNPIRTVSLVIILGLSIGLALAMLVAYQAVGKKIASVQSSVGNTVAISPAGVRGFAGGGNPLTQDQMNQISKLDHVSNLNETLSDRLSSSDTNLVSAVDAGSLGRRFRFNNDDGAAPPVNVQNNNGATASFTPPVLVTGTNNPNILSDNQGGGSLNITSGTGIDGTSHDNIALVGSSLATKNNLQVGSTFTAYGQTITVKGIFDAGNSFANNQVIMPLATVQTLSNQATSVTAATVTVDSVTNIDSVTGAVKNVLGSNADVTNSAEQAKNAIAPLQNIRSISLYSLIGAVIAGAVIILLSMIMIVRERRREIGVLKAIGASNSKVIGQFMTEAVTLTLMGAVVGILLGLIGGNPITKLLVDNSTNAATQTAPGQITTMVRGGGRLLRASGGSFGGGLRNNLSNIHATIGYSIIFYGLLAALLIAVIGSAFASYFITKIRPAEVMRAE